MEPYAKICVVGCGAIGGLLTAHLMNKNHTVQVIDQGAQLQALRKHGLCLLSANGEIHLSVKPAASGRFDWGAQDIIFLAVKSHQIPEVAPQLGQLTHKDTMIVTLQNGLPWWYFQRHGGPFDNQRLELVDPGGVISRHIDPRRIVGCVAYPAAVVEEPGVIRHIEGTRFPVGELNNYQSDRIEILSSLLNAAGFKSPVLSDLRGEIWLKLWGTLAFNPISMLTRATMEDICRHSGTRALARDMMLEAETIASKLGVKFRVRLEKRLAGGERVGAHKTSTLQDLEAGRATELDALLGAVIELGQLTDTPTPQMDAVYACCSLLERTVTGADECR